MLESVLLDNLKNRGINAAQREVRRALLKLEVTGYIRVTSLDEERKIIELVNSKEPSA
jgi:repressor of nif and glnA expression